MFRYLQELQPHLLQSGLCLLHNMEPDQLPFAQRRRLLRIIRGDILNATNHPIGFPSILEHFASWSYQGGGAHFSVAFATRLHCQSLTRYFSEIMTMILTLLPESGYQWVVYRVGVGERRWFDLSVTVFVDELVLLPSSLPLCLLPMILPSSHSDFIYAKSVKLNKYLNPLGTSVTPITTPPCLFKSPFEVA